MEEDLKVMGLVEDDLVRGRKHKAWVKDQEKRGSNLVPHLASMDIRNNPAHQKRIIYHEYFYFICH